MMLSLWIAVMVLAAAILLSLVRISTVRDGASRAIAGEVIFFSGVGLLILIGALRGSAVSVDLAMIVSIVGILTTVAFARIITRGRR